MLVEQFTCHDCKATKPVATSGGTGYATLREPAGVKVCYACAGERDRREMIETGRATLYLTTTNGEGKLTNWPGTLSIWPIRLRKGRHNMAESRYDVWFTGPDGKPWHGVQYGENTQICHCKRIKS